MAENSTQHHHHGSHMPAILKLNDTKIHLKHHFPPSYLAADFKLCQDTAIFGEEFDQTWNKEEIASHKGLMVLHVLGYYGAYFGIMPLGK
jgi:hypothetical protein